MSLATRWILPAVACLLLVGCDDPWDPGSCGNFDYFLERTGKSYSSDPRCSARDMKGQVGSIEMRIDEDGSRVFLAYDRKEEDGTVVRVEEVWRIDEPGP